MASTVGGAEPTPTHVGGVVIDDEHLRFTLADADGRFRDVRLYQELQRPRDGLRLAMGHDRWTCALPRPDRLDEPALRLEYAYIVEHHDGGHEFITDPANPLLADGPFGAKSVVELPGYRRPAWLDAPDQQPRVRWHQQHLRRFHDDATVGLWQPEGVADDAPLPLLVAHDGPEYARYSRLLDLLAHAVGAGRVPPLRVALLAPLDGRRDATYSAAALHADALAFTLLPWLETRAPSPSWAKPVLMGASLGGLASLHAAHRHPGRFGGLFLQSGSFFRLATDGQERGFAHFDRVSRFVGAVQRTTRVERALPIAMTCGTIEENLANNQVMATALRDAGHDVTFKAVPDGHTYTAWRDALDPTLIDLLARTTAG